MGVSCGQQLGVDVELAHASRDQLGELAPEVEDRHGVGLFRGLGGDALRRRRVEGLLEVRLDLGVVWGEDAVPRIRGLAVDRPSALGLLWLRVAQSRSVRRCWPQV